MSVVVMPKAYIHVIHKALLCSGCSYCTIRESYRTFRYKFWIADWLFRVCSSGLSQVRPQTDYIVVYISSGTSNSITNKRTTVYSAVEALWCTFACAEADTDCVSIASKNNKLEAGVYVLAMTRLTDSRAEEDDACVCV